MNYTALIVATAAGVLTLVLVEAVSRRTQGQPFPAIWRSWFFWILQGVQVMVASALALTLKPTNLPIAFFVGVSVPVLIQRLVTQQNRRLQDLALQKDLEEAERKVEEHPKEARPVWEVSRLQLELYIRRNQSQVNSIFWITVAVMVVGFFLVAIGVYQAFNAKTIESALLTTASGVITQFIGATFLYIYKSTIAQAGSYTLTLERINSVGMAVQILDSIPDDKDEVKNQARAGLVSQILGRETSGQKP